MVDSIKGFGYLSIVFVALTLLGLLGALVLNAQGGVTVYINGPSRLLKTLIYS